MEAIKKVFDIFLVIIAIISVVFIATFIIYKYVDKGIYRDGSSTYATSVVDPKTGEEKTPLNVSYYQNYNNTGKEVVEFQVRAYSDQNKQALYLRGYQLVIDKNKGNQLWYYDTYDGTSFPSGHKYDEENGAGQLKNFYYIECDGNLVAMRLDGSYVVKKTKTNGWKIFRTVATLGINTAFEGTNFKNTTTTTYYYTMEDLLLKIREIIKGCSYGTGDYTLPLVDLGDFLHLYDVNDVGKVDAKPLGYGGQINSYFSVDVHFDRRGMSYASQSMFGSVLGDGSYNITGIDFDVNYWKSTMTYNLTEQDFVARYSNVDMGYYYSLSTSTINELKNFDNLEINITFDISKIKNVNVLGFDHYALNGLKVNKLLIKNNVQKDFTLLVGALKDTGLSNVETENVNIIDLSNLGVAV